MDQAICVRLPPQGPDRTWNLSRLLCSSTLSFFFRNKRPQFLNDTTRRNVWSCSSFHVGGWEWGWSPHFVKILFRNRGSRGSHRPRTGRTAVEAETSAQSYAFISRCFIRQMVRLTCADRIWAEVACRYGSIAVTRRVLL